MRVLLTLPLLATLLVAGCAEPDGPRVASADQGNVRASQAAPSPTPGKPTEQEKGILFARCMTDKGVRVDDPVDGNAPRIRIEGGGIIFLGGVPEGLPEYSAWKACRHLYPTVTYRRLDPKEAAEYRAYARCMTDLGITDGLSTLDENGMLASENDAATRVGEDRGPTPEFMSAHYKCRKHLSGGEGDPPPLDDPFAGQP